MGESEKMSETTVMSDTHGKFVWYELLTSDTAGAEAFYRRVMGWDAKDSGIPDIAYTLFSAGQREVAGLMALPEKVREAGGPPAWMGYVDVDDLDASVAKAVKRGAKVYHGPADIPGVGRFAVIADPQGAVIGLFWHARREPGPQVAEGTPGHAGWRELMAGDREAAFAFYADLFGWKKGDAVDIGPMGIYQIFAHREERLGGMMTKPETVPSPHWRYYFNVAGIDAAATRVRDAGGELLHDPHEVPGGSWIVQCNDPQGALFALVGPRG
jgi:uncharacterized protein